MTKCESNKYQFRVGNGRAAVSGNIEGACLHVTKNPREVEIRNPEGKMIGFFSAGDGYVAVWAEGERHTC